MAKSIDEKIEELKERIYQSKLQDHAKINRLGWGYGMRCVKMPTFTKTDKLEARLKKLKEQKNVT